MNQPRREPVHDGDGGRAARLFHTLSSFGWYPEPPVSGPVSGVGVPARNPAADTLAIFADLLMARSSQRDFTGAAITVDQLLALLWCGYGLVDPGATPRATVPSAGGLLPLRLVVLPLAVSLARARLHLFEPSAVTLRPLRSAAPDRAAQWFHTRHVDYDRAAAAIVVVADIAQPLHRYGERGYRYALLEAGHVGQNLCLAAVALGMGAVPLGGFDDETVNAALTADLDGQVALYALAVGDVGLRIDPRAASALVRRVRAAVGDSVVEGQ